MAVETKQLFSTKDSLGRGQQPKSSLIPQPSDGGAQMGREDGEICSHNYLLLAHDLSEA